MPAALSFVGGGTGYQGFVVVEEEQEECRRGERGVKGLAQECPRNLGPGLESQSFPFPCRAVRSVAHSPLNVPVRPESRSTAPSCPLDPFLRLHPLPPLAAAVTKRSSRTAVSVRPPLPTARGGSRDSSRHLRWLRSHDSEGGGSPNPIPEAHLHSGVSPRPKRPPSELNPRRNGWQVAAL